MYHSSATREIVTARQDGKYVRMIFMLPEIGSIMFSSCNFNLNTLTLLFVANSIPLKFICIGSCISWNNHAIVG